MEKVTEVEWEWTATCPVCASQYCEYDEQVNTDGTHPIITCDSNFGLSETCGCVFEVTCIEC